MCKYVSDVNIEEKKVMFVFLKDYYIKNVYTTLSDMDDKSQSEIIDSIILHLVKKTLVIQPFF